MITFETAVEYALLAYGEADYFTEYENVYIFDCSSRPEDYDGPSPVVIEKETGNWTTINALMSSAVVFDPGAYVREGKIPREMRSTHSELRDAVYGAAVGDALGVPYEFMDRGSFECTGMTGWGTHHQPAGTFSDDTSMILALCDSIRAKEGEIRVGDIFQRFHDWVFKGSYAIDGEVFDIGNTVRTALTECKGLDGERDNGNGSLMRTAPLAYTKATDEQVRYVSAITHAHRYSTESCVLFVNLMREIIEGVPFDEALEKSIPDDEAFAFLRDIASRPIDEVRSGGFVLDTLGAAIWCFANTDSYADCVLAAVNLGDDTDTTAAVAGALAGAFYGCDAIPVEWLSDLRGKDIIESCLFDGTRKERG